MKFLKYTLITSALVASLAATENSEPGLDEILADDPIFVELAERQVDTQPDVIPAKLPDDESEKLNATLNAVKQEFDSIFENYLYLNQAESLNQIELYKLKLFVDNEIKKITANFYVERLSEVIYWFKFACLNLELLSVSNGESKLAVLSQPLDFVEIQQAKFKILSKMLSLYRPSLEKDVALCSASEFSEKRVNRIVFECLPERLQYSVWSYALLGATQSSSQAYYLSKILSSNFYTQKIILSEEYLDIVSSFYKAQKLGHELDYLLFYNKIDKLILDFSVTRSATTCKNLTLAIELLLSKLIKIKNDVAKFYKPALLLQDNPYKAKLLVRYKLLLEDKNLELFCTDKQFYEFFDLYCCVLQNFFVSTASNQTLAVKLFELECKLEKLLNDKQTAFWKKILKKVLYKKDQSITVLDEIAKLLSDASALANKDLYPKENGLLSNIFSGNWVDTGSFKNAGISSAETFVEFMGYLFNRKFDNFKAAAFFLLARTSPVLAAGLVHKILPYLSGDMKTKVSSLMDETEQGDRDDNKVFDFIAKNPEIFNKLCDVKPELVNGLASVVEQKLNIVKT